MHEELELLWLIREAVEFPSMQAFRSWLSIVWFNKVYLFKHPCFEEGIGLPNLTILL